jgi:RHS repeat-associated protein
MVGLQANTLTYAEGKVSITDATAKTTSLYFNQNGQMAKIIDPVGNATYLTHDSKFNLISVTNAVGAKAVLDYNKLGQLISAKDFLGNITNVTYGGPQNQPKVLSDAKGNQTRYDYSPTGNLLKTTFANGKLESTTFDPLGNALSFTNSAYEAIQYSHNAAGQVTGATFPDGSSFTYTYDNRGRLLTATDTSGTITFTYHPVTGFMTGVAYPEGRALTFTYDTGGRRSSMVDHTGFTVKYGYDAVGRLSTLKDAGNSLIVTYTYDANGRLSQKTNANGTYSTYIFDANGRVLSLINRAPGGTINSRFDDTYNALGLKTSETTLEGAWTYTYDANGQLTRAVFASNNVASIPNQDLVYQYDALGNRTSTVINGVTTNYVADNMNQYESVGGTPYNYDAKGNLLSDGTSTFTYNVLNKLIGVTGASGTTSYSYNALGQRVSTTAAGQTSKDLIDPAGLGNIVGTFGSGGSLIAQYVHGLGLTSQVGAGGSSYYDSDVLGSIAGMSGSGGSYTNRYSYLPFGGSLQATNTVQNPFQYVGGDGVENQGGGILFMRARFMNAESGRFVNKDPIGLSGGDVNLLRYVGNNPISKSDPTGWANFLGIEINMFTDTRGKLVQDMIAVDGNHGSNPNPGKTISDAQDKAQRELGALGGGVEGLGMLGGVGKPVGELVKDLTQQGIADAATNGLHDDGGVWNGDNWWRFWEPEIPEPTIPGEEKGGTGSGTLLQSMDPNAVYGPSGYGPSNFVTGFNNTFAYRVTYENFEDATAPAQSVTVTNNLDSNLDWSTFQLTGIGFADNYLVIPPGNQHYQATVSMTYNGLTFDVEMEAGIHSATGQVYASFYSIDPNTSLPPSNVLTGFLPPEDGTGRGEGYISYTVSPKSGLGTGVVIPNIASIVFDANAPITTDQVDPLDPSKGIDPAKQARVTIDAGVPQSEVSVLPGMSGGDFTVNWSGRDDGVGSGIGAYTLYVSDDGGQTYRIWLTNTSLTSAQFTGEAGKTYQFYSVARDNTGNEELAPATADATTVSLGVWCVGQVVSVDVSLLGNVVSATGMPGGTKLDGATRRLIGRPNSPGNFSVSFGIRGSNGKVTVTQLATRVEALPTWTQGAFTALIVPPRPMTANLDGLGGLLTLNSTPTGAYTGTLRLGAKSFPVRGQINGVPAAHRGSDPLRSQVFVVPNPKVPTDTIALNLEFRSEAHASLPGLTGTLAYAGRNLVIGPGWQHVWNAKTKPAFGSRDRVLNVAIGNTSTGNGPRGDGYATLKLTKAGAVTWVGTLADGKSFSGSFTASPDGELLLYVPLAYPGGGCAIALLRTELAGNTNALMRVVPMADSDNRWIKRGSADVKDRTYRDGFDAQIAIRGAEYRAPANGQLLFGTGMTPSALDFRMDGTGVGAVFGAGSDEIGLDAELQTGNKIAVVEPGLGVSLMPGTAPATGILTGATALVNTIGSTKVTRSLEYKGLYIPDPDQPENSMVAGFFLMPALPGAGQAATTTLITSGKLRIARPLDFGLVPVGSRAARGLILSNPGGAALTITGITCPTGFATEPLALPLTLQPDTVREVRVFFVPTAELDYVGDISIVTSAETQTRSCNGRGVDIPAALLNWSIGGNLRSPMVLGPIFADHGNVIGVSGLPPGVTFNATAGTLAGTPRTPGAFMVSFIIQRPDGTKTAMVLQLIVEPLPAWAVGTFTSMISAPNDPATPLIGLGGYLNLTSSPTGAYTVSLTLGAKTYAFKGQIEGVSLVLRSEARLGLLQAHLIIPDTKDPTQNIGITVEFRPNDHATLPGLTGTLTFQSIDYPIQPGWQHVWNAKTKPAFGNKDRALNMVIENSSNANGPQGDGFASIRLTKAGLASWAATLSDGRKLTGSFTALPDGDVPFYAAIPYPNGGALHAMLQIAPSGDFYRVSDSPQINGRWIKQQTTNPSTLDRLYPSGFDVNLVFSGAEHRAPARGVLLFGNPTPPKAISFTLNGAGITGSSQLPGNDPVNLTAELRTNNLIILPPQSGLPTILRIAPSFSTATGLVSGSIALSDIAPLTSKATPRSLPYSGLYIPNLASPVSSRVRGFFTLPELPDIAGETPMNTPINSGVLHLAP